MLMSHVRVYESMYVCMNQCSHYKGEDISKL